MNSKRSFVLFFIASVVLLLVVWLVGGNAWAARREKQCERAWTDAFGTTADLQRRYPARVKNATAGQLEVAAKALGLDLAAVDPGPGSRSRSLSDADAKTLETIAEYVSAQLAKADASVDTPPAPVARFLGASAASLDAIESLLAAGPAPEWDSDPSATAPAPLQPNGVATIRLHRILIARSLAAASAGRFDLATRSSEASWALNESLRHRPVTISTLLAMANSRSTVGALRKIDVRENIWGPRLATLEYRTPLRDGLVIGTQPVSLRAASSAPAGRSEDGVWWSRISNALAGPSERLAMIDYSDEMRAELVRLRDAPLSDRLPESPTQEAGNFARTMIHIALPNIKNAFLRADRLVVDAELTSKVLAARRLRKENGGRWPASIAGIETSRFPGATWRYEVSPEGRMSIAFSKELLSPYGNFGPPPLPLSFSSN